jgi:uroporphyrin-III C-methyltransferase/precorrin-2 dehydrogenase/sirohydrochlorin ferrochelatase
VTPGLVSLVGAGPGDPDLLTRLALRRLRRADIVFHDGLVPEPILAVARRASRQSVAKRAGRAETSQQAISDALIDASRLGVRVVRLKVGDPYVLGRGGEEAHALEAAGIPFEIVPGISAALAAPALAGIPLTYRGVASGFVVLSGHDPHAYVPILDGLRPLSATLVVLMGLATRASLTADLLTRGWPDTTPAAVVVDASRPDEFVWAGTLAGLPGFSTGTSNALPGVIVIGPVVALRTKEHSHVRVRQSALVGSRPVGVR